MKRAISLVLCLIMGLILLLSAASAQPANDVAIKKITLSQKKATLLVGREPLTLTATITPAEAASEEVIWTSGKPAVATVVNGVVTPLSPGKATIACKAANGKAKATCVVTVKPVPVESLTAAPKELSLSVGEASKLAATVAPDDATYKTPVFKSTKPKIASVDSAGLVTGVKAGKAVVAVSVKGFARKVKIPVTVEGGGGGGGGGKYTANITSVKPIRLTYYRTANGAVKSVEIQFSIESSNGGTASLRKFAKQTSFYEKEFYKYDFDVSEDINLYKGMNTVTRMFYAAPWTYMGTDAPFLIRLIVSGKNGASEPLSYRLPLYAVKLTEW